MPLFTPASALEKVSTIAASGATLTLVDTTVATMHDITLSASCTFTFPTIAAGKSFTMLARQDATGSRTATWPATVKWVPAGAAPTLTTTANAVDWLAFSCVDGSHWLGAVVGLDSR